MKWSTQRLKSKSFQIKLDPTVCDHNQKGKPASQIVSNSEENMKMVDGKMRHNGPTWGHVEQKKKKSENERKDWKIEKN